MKKLGLVLVFSLFLCLNINSGCSCLPASSGLQDNYQLVELVGSNMIKSYRDSTYYLEITTKDETTGIKENEDIVRNGESVLSRHIVSSWDIPCGRKSNNTFKVFYEDGTIRRYHIPEPNQLEASEYLLEGEADTVLYRYEAVN